MSSMGLIIAAASSATGAAIGSLSGPQGAFIGAQIGWTIGSTLGSYIVGKSQTVKQESGQLNDLNVTLSTYGVTVPRVWGSMRVAGNVIVLDKLKEDRDQKTKDGVKVVTYTYYREYSAVAFTQGEIERFEKIWGNEKLIYTNYISDSPDSFNDEWLVDATYLGTEVQDPSVSLIFNGMDATTLPAFRGIAYTVWGRITYGEFSNSMPNLTALVRSTAAGTETLDNVVSDICEMAGLAAAQIDVTDLASVTVSGFRFSSQASARTVLEQLQSIYLFDVVETDGKLKFIRRGVTASVVTIPYADLVAFQSSGVTTYVEVTRAEEKSLPRYVEVTYLAPSLKYQQHTKRAERINTTSYERISIDVPVALTHEEAQTIAYKLLTLKWQERDSYKWQTGIKYAYLDVGDIVTVQSQSATYTILITRMQVGLFGRIAFEGVSHASAVYGWTIPGTGEDIEEELLHLTDTMLIMVDSPIIANADDTYLWYFGVTAATEGYWDESDVYNSPDDISYLYRQTVTLDAYYGVADSALANGPYLYWDNGNTLDITMTSGTLTSAPSTTAVIANRTLNLLKIGDELLQYVTATDIGGGVYRISTLLRGRFGTEGACAAHGTSETVVVFDRLYPEYVSVAHFNIEWYWKAVTEGLDEAATLGTGYTNTGKSLRPYAPNLYQVLYDGTDVRVIWWRRTRLPDDWFLAVIVPLGETSEAYTIRFTQGVVTQDYSASSESYTRSKADLLSDGFSAGAPITVSVAQLSSTYGAGPFSEELTVTL